jgi:N-methylhydantoinase A
VTLRLGIDTGGTFTDFILLDEETGSVTTAKVPSTPDDPARAIGDGLALLACNQRIDLTVVGTTIATNAVLEGVGPPLLFIANAGFEDVPFIGRLDKEHLYDLHWVKPRPLVERANCFGVPGRVDHHGVVVEELPDVALDALVERLRPFADEKPAVAICLLFSYLHPEHELEVARAVRRAIPGAAVSLSHETSPVWREYERANTTLVDAFVKPAIDRYVEHVGETLLNVLGSAHWNLLGSNGGYLSAEEAQRRPAQLLISGLAGGVIGGRFFAESAGVQSAFTLDMGGTSCDLGLIRGQSQQYASEFDLAWGLPVTIPCVAVKTIGAGGGSIASVDRGGLLHVGPRSAGARPGPVSYGHGGHEPTVTDANLVLGRISPDYFLGGSVPLDARAALRALSKLGGELGLSAHEAALATLHTADENMANAIRLIAVDHGIDARDFALIAFGGAGPLQARSVARRLEIDTVVIPVSPGLCSAFGCAITEARVDRVQTHYTRSGAENLDRLAAALVRLVADAAGSLERSTGRPPTTVRRSADLRYVGQNYELEIDVPEGELDADAWSELLMRYEAEHLARYGFMLAHEPIELINVRVTAVGTELRPRLGSSSGGMAPPAGSRIVWFEELGPVETPVLRRSALAADSEIDGPVVFEEVDSTTLLCAGDRARVAEGGELVITVGSSV